MKKYFLLGFVALAMSLGFTSCDKEDDLSQVQDKTGTYVSVTLKMGVGQGQGVPSKAPSALPDDYNYLGEWAGKDKIEKVSIYLVEGSDVSLSSFNVDGTDYSSAKVGNQVVLTPLKAIKTTVGTKKVYVLLNATADVEAHLASINATEFEKAYKETALALANSGTNPVVNMSADKLAVKNGVADERIVMSNVTNVSITLDANITEAEALGTGSLPKKNNVNVNVQRAVARVMITTKDDTFEVRTKTNALIGEISDITWSIAQGEKSLYLQQKADYATPNYGFIPADDADYIANAGSKYDYSGLFTSTSVPKMAAYSGVLGEVTAELDAQLSGKFLLPNTHAFGTASASSYKRGNTAYVLVRAIFTPDAAAFADGGAAYVKGNDFWLGDNGRYYKTEVNTQNPAQGGVVGQAIAKYVGGKVLYYAWVNPDEVPNFFNSPVLRNNIYHIHITGFKSIGTNWNPLYPEDPTRELTDPLKPYDPVTNPWLEDKANPDPKPPVNDVTIPDIITPVDPDKPLKDEDTYMSVDVTILPWLVHSYSIDLGF